MLKIRKGDSCNLEVKLTQNGEPYELGYDEEAVFSIKKDFEDDSPPLIKHTIKDGYVKITHEDTKGLDLGVYFFDVRVFDRNLEEVYTPIFDKLKIEGVVNNDLQNN